VHVDVLLFELVVFEAKQVCVWNLAQVGLNQRSEASWGLQKRALRVELVNFFRSEGLISTRQLDLLLLGPLQIHL